MLRSAVKRVLIPVAMLASAPSLSQADAMSGPEYQLVLNGSALALCSSMAPQNCLNTDWIDVKTMRSQRFLNLTDRYVKPMLDDKNWPYNRREIRDRVAGAIDLIKQRIQDNTINERVFQEEFTRRALQDLYNNLSDTEWNLILDSLETPLPDSLQEQVNLRETKALAERRLLDTFMGQAERAATANGNDGKPRVLVVNAGARDPYNQVDYYLNVFRAAGAEVSWLPVDAAVYQAQLQGKCGELAQVREQVLKSWQRERVFPAKHAEQVEFCGSAAAGVEMVRNADAVYFAAGDAHLIRKAFVNPVGQPSPLLTELYLRNNANKLVIGAAGGAVAALSSQVMLSNGTSAEALASGAIAADAPAPGCDINATCGRDLTADSLTYHPLGGLGLFDYGILDSEFSSNGRQGRLLRLAATTSVALGIGVDHATALLVNVNRNTFRIAGEGGVFFAQGAQQTDTAVASGFSYLMAGSSGRFEAGAPGQYDLADVSFASTGTVVTETPTNAFLDNRGMIDSLRLFCQDATNFELLQSAYKLVAMRDDNTQVQKAGGECQVLNARVGIVYQPQAQF